MGQIWFWNFSETPTILYLKRSLTAVNAKHMPITYVYPPLLVYGCSDRMFRQTICIERTLAVSGVNFTKKVVLLWCTGITFSNPLANRKQVLEVQKICQILLTKRKPGTICIIRPDNLVVLLCLAIIARTYFSLKIKIVWVSEKIQNQPRPVILPGSIHHINESLIYLLRL